MNLSYPEGALADNREAGGLGARPLTSDIIEWDVSNWSVALDYWRQATSLELSNSQALELGARNGGLSLWLAANGCHVTCSDLHGPTPQARKLHRRYDVSHLITYEPIDAVNIP